MSWAKPSPSPATTPKRPRWTLTTRAGTAPAGAPPAPTGLQVTSDGDSLLVRWQAEADPESGIGYFNIYVDGERVARFPEKGEYQSFDRNGDNTRPVTPPEMSVRLPRPAAKSVHIAVETVNQYGIPSERRASVKVKQ